MYSPPAPSHMTSGKGGGGGGFLVFIYCWSYSMCFTCGNCHIHTYIHIHSSAERPEQWKLIESINENMNNEGGSFTFWGLYLEWRAHTHTNFFVYVFVCTCVVCMYIRCRLSASISRCCACLWVYLCMYECLKIQQSYISDLTWFILARLAFTVCMFCLHFCLFFFFWFYFLFIFHSFLYKFFPIHIVFAIIFHKSEPNNFWKKREW